jgi:hypothetical protein
MSFAQLMDTGSQGSFRSVPVYFVESCSLHARRDPSANHCDVAKAPVREVSYRHIARLVEMQREPIYTLTRLLDQRVESNDSTAG